MKTSCVIYNKDNLNSAYTIKLHFQRVQTCCIYWGGFFISKDGVRTIQKGEKGEREKERERERERKNCPMKTIFVPLQRTRSSSHNCQSCNKSPCATNEYCIGNETKLIAMQCQLDLIQPPFQKSQFTCRL